MEQSERFCREIDTSLMAIFHESGGICSVCKLFLTIVYLCNISFILSEIRFVCRCSRKQSSETVNQMLF